MESNRRSENWNPFPAEGLWGALRYLPIDVGRLYEVMCLKTTQAPTFSLIIFLLLLIIANQRNILHPSSFLSPSLPSILSSAFFFLWKGSTILYARGALSYWTITKYVFHFLLWNKFSQSWQYGLEPTLCVFSSNNNRRRGHKFGKEEEVMWKFALSSGEDPSHLSWLWSQLLLFLFFLTL